MSATLLAVSDTTTFVQLSVSGAALGSVYALVALSFAVVLKATGVLNLFQGMLVMVGAYLTYAFHVKLHLPFVIAVLIAVLLCIGLGLAAHFGLFAKVGNSEGVSGLFASLMIAIGLLEIGEAVVTSVWGADPLSIGDPWALRSWHFGSISVTQRDVWVIAITVVLLVAFWWLFERSRLGVAMRASASDPEAAAAQGIRPSSVLSLAWIISATVAVIAGVMLATAVGGGATNTLDSVAFLALPALILGGVGSVAGSVVGGVILGLAQTYAAGYGSSDLGTGFSEVVPFLIMILILLVRPSGLFGSAEMRRA